MFGRILSAHPLPVPQTAQNPFHAPSAPALLMPSFNSAVGARIDTLLAERPDFFQAVILVLNGLGLPSPFYPPSTEPPKEHKNETEEPLAGQRIKRGSELISEDSSRKIPKL